MNELLEKFLDYKKIVRYKFCYEFVDGTKIIFKYKQTDFPHLIGLHKLIDIPIIRQFNDSKNTTVSAKYLLSKIRKEELLTESRYKAEFIFSENQVQVPISKNRKLLSIAYTDAIINFYPQLINSTLCAKFILFEEQEKGYNHLCIAEDKQQNQYVESFFYDETDLYLRNQIKVKVKNIKILDKSGSLYLEDNL